MAGNSAVLLLVDTTGPWCQIAVSRGEAVLACVSEASERRHGESFFALIEQALRRAAIGFDSLSAIAVCTGPGGYAGLRVGVAACLGLAHGADLPVVGVPRDMAISEDFPMEPRALAVGGLTRLVSGRIGAQPLYRRPPDAVIATHRAPPLLPDGR